jgi:hypothetical protein
MDIIIGSILGDGSVDKHGHFTEEHSIKQADYLLWKYNLLRDLCASEPKISKRGVAIRFRTRKIFEELREEWYGTGRKALPEHFEEYLNPRVFAIWFMDDGDKKGSSHKGKTVEYLADFGMRLSICCFNRKESRRIERAFALFGIVARAKREGKYYRLSIPSSNGNSKKFADMIKPYMTECMLYKIPDFRPSERGKHWGNKRQIKDGKGRFTGRYEAEGVETRQGAAHA